MISVCVDLTSAERIRLTNADHFSVQNEQLLVYKGADLVAQFRSWAYVVKGEETESSPDLAMLESTPAPVFPKGATWVPPPNYKPLTIKPAQLSAPDTSSFGPTHTPGAGAPPADATAAPAS